MIRLMISLATFGLVVLYSAGPTQAQECKDKPGAQSQCQDGNTQGQCKDGKDEGECGGGECSGECKMEGAGKPINTFCPVTGKPLGEETVVVGYRGKPVGLHCKGALSKWQTLSEAQRTAAFKQAMRMTERAGWQGDPYTLDTCIVTGDKLGSMGEPIVKKYDGREVRFCCEMCVSKFEAAKDSYFKKIDRKLVRSQMPYYPTSLCVVSGEPLTDESINVIYKNRLVRLCCDDCRDTFLKSPNKFLARLDRAVIAQQSKLYPLDTCVVTDEAFTDEEKPIDKVYANRLVRLSCEGCVMAFEKNPALYVGKLDKAWKDKYGDSLPDLLAKGSTTQRLVKQGG